jgi:uncharacterized membrane protein YGL010W
MRSLDTWLAEYSLDHQNPSNRRIHFVCVPLIFASVAGGLSLLPMSIGHIILALALVWYSTLGWKAFAIAFAQIMIAVALTTLLQNETSTTVTPVVLGVIFILAWIGQFYGHKLEGRKPSFFKDLQYLFIGPLWVWLGH